MRLLGGLSLEQYFKDEIHPLPELHNLFGDGVDCTHFLGIAGAIVELPQCIWFLTVEGNYHFVDRPVRDKNECLIS